jgi:hypothetical protein
MATGVNKCRSVILEITAYFDIYQYFRGTANPLNWHDFKWFSAPRSSPTLPTFHRSHPLKHVERRQRRTI